MKIAFESRDLSSHIPNEPCDSDVGFSMSINLSQFLAKFLRNALCSKAINSLRQCCKLNLINIYMTVGTRPLNIDRL